MDNKDKYVRFNCYDSKLKKNVGYTIKKENFNYDDDKIKDHINKIRNDHKYRNEMHKKNIQKDILDTNEFNIKITPFNLNLDYNTGNTLGLFGSGKQGKSSLLMYIYNKYYAQEKDYICTLFSINSHIKVYKADKKLLRCNSFTKEAEKYIKMQKYINSHTSNKYKFANFFDDVIDVKYKKILNEMILTYRNSNISTIISLQYPYLLSKQNRANLNGICLFQTNSSESIKDIIDTFLKHHFIKMGITHYNDMVNFYKKATENHSFIYINNLNDSISYHKLQFN